MTDLVTRALQEGILDRGAHEQLLLQLGPAAERAGVPVEAICRHLRDYVGEPEREWCRAVVRSRRAPPPGLLYVGAWPDVGRRMEGIAGALVRNFIDARVMAASRAVEERPTCSVLLVPNLCARGARLAGWQNGLLADLVIERTRGGTCATVLHVDSIELLRAEFGASFCSTLDGYTTLEAR